MVAISLVTTEDPAEGLWPYLLEIMASEGLPRPGLLPRRRLAQAGPEPGGVVIVPAVELSPEAVARLMEHMRRGGSLLALRPCPRLAAALGLRPADGIAPRLCQDAYLELHRPHPLLAAIPEDIDYLQYHGPADAYVTDAPERPAATIYWGGTTMPYSAILSGRPAQGGRYVVFAYDLALSTMLFHQGRRSQSSLGDRPDLSGDDTYTPNDLFVGYLDAGMRRIPQADLQQRVLSSALEWLLEEEMPLPRLWYFPDGKPAIALIDGDSDAMNLDEMRLYADTVERAGGKYTLYLMTMHYDEIGPEVVADYRARGHDFGPHIWTSLKPTPRQFDEHVQDEVDHFRRRYGFQPASTRHHCVVWPGWVEPAKALRRAGIGMEVNFRAAQHFREGYVTGSGLPYPYVDDQGEVVEVYQQPTLLSDDFLYQNKSFLRPLKSEEVIALTREMTDECIGRYHTVMQPYFHPIYARTDPPLVPGTYTVPWLQATVAHCRDRGLDMPSLEQWLRFSRARRAAALTGLSYAPEAGTLRFRLQAGGAEADARGLTLLLPSAWHGRPLRRVRRNGRPADFTVATRMGGDYALLDAGADLGEVEAEY